MFAIAWALSFAAIHVAWALGSTVGLGGRRVTGVLLAIDIVAIPLCLLAAWVAWRLGDERRSAMAPRVIHAMAWTACVLLTLRGLGTIQALIVPSEDATTLTRLVDPFFLVGGLLFGLVAHTGRPSARRETGATTPHRAKARMCAPGCRRASTARWPGPSRVERPPTRR